MGREHVVGLYLDTTDALLINLGAGYIIVFTLGKVIKLYNFCTSLHVILPKKILRNKFPQLN